MRGSTARNVSVLAVAAAVLTVGAAAPPSHGHAPREPAPPRGEDSGGDRLRRSGRQRRRRGLRGGPRVLTGRQRRRRGRRDRGRARCHRALLRRASAAVATSSTTTPDGKVRTIDGRETAPALRTTPRSSPRTGKPLTFARAVTSGSQCRRPRHRPRPGKGPAAWGTPRSRRRRSRPSASPATASPSTTPSARRPRRTSRGSRTSPPPRGSSCRGARPAVGSVFQNPDLAATYTARAARGIDWLYDGGSAARSSPPSQPARTPGRDPHRAARRPDGARTRGLPPGQAPTHVGYRGFDVYGMAPPSSGGSTVGEALNILETACAGCRAAGPPPLPRASALAFADRGKYVGDPAFVDVPLQGCSRTGSPTSGPA